MQTIVVDFGHHPAECRISDGTGGLAADRVAKIEVTQAVLVATDRLALFRHRLQVGQPAVEPVFRERRRETVDVCLILQEDEQDQWFAAQAQQELMIRNALI